MAQKVFESTVRNLLQMKPQPHKEKGKAGIEGGPKPAPGTGSLGRNPELHQQKDDPDQRRR